MEQDGNSYFKLDELTSVVINNAFDAIVYYVPVCDNEGSITDFRFTWLNDSAMNYLSGSRDQYIGSKFLDLFPYAAENGMFRDFKKTAETAVRSEDVYYYECGKHKGWYRNSVIKFQQGIIVYFRDISKRKQLELDLKNNNQHLQKLLQEREMLLKETHHRVKNNIQIISSMLNLQKNGILDPNYREIFNVCIQRLRTMALIHQQLYEDNLYGDVNLYNFSSAIISSLFSVYNTDDKRIRIRNEMEELYSDFDFAVKIGLILNELITNSVKYAFTGMEEGEIIITLRKNENELILQVKDNGKGLPFDFDPLRLNSLGLILVQSLTDDLEGKMEVMSSPGTAFTIHLPGEKVIYQDSLKHHVFNSL